MLIIAQSYNKLETSIQLQREESAEKSNESRKMLWILQVMRERERESLLAQTLNNFMQK